MTAYVLEDEESKMPLKFQALVTRRWKPGECLREVEGREQDMVNLVLDLEIGDGGICMWRCRIGTLVLSEN